LPYEETQDSLKLPAQQAEQHRLESVNSQEHGRPTKRDRRSIDKINSKDWGSRWSASAD